MTVDQLTSKTTPEVMTAMPTVLAAYNQLTSPDARSTFGDLIERERPLLDAERATVAERERALDAQRGVLLSGRVSEATWMHSMTHSALGMVNWVNSRISFTNVKHLSQNVIVDGATVTCYLIDMTQR
jgi:hypothetical protein